MAREHYTAKPEILKKLDRIDALIENITKVTQDIRKNIPATTACKNHNVNIRKFGRLMHYVSKPSEKTKYQHTNAIEYILLPAEKIYMEITDISQIEKVPLHINDTMPRLIREILSIQQQQVIEQRYYQNKSLQDIGDNMGLTRERIRQIKDKAICQLKQPENLNILNFGYENIEKLNTVRKDAYANEWDSLIKKAEKEGVYNAQKDAVETVVKYINMPDEIRNKKPEEILSMSLYDLDFSVRTHNCLFRANIRTLKDITMMTENDLRKIKNLGIISLDEIKKRLNDYGLSLAEDKKE